jgi:hypothetical protein
MTILEHVLDLARDPNQWNLDGSFEIRHGRRISVGIFGFFFADLRIDGVLVWVGLMGSIRLGAAFRRIQRTLIERKVRAILPEARRGD